MSTQTATGRPRPRWLIVALVGVVAVLVVVAAFLATRPEPAPAPAPAPAPTVVGPTPTPELEPVERDTGTPLTAALPDEVLAFAAVSQEELDADAGALQAYRLTYSDGAQRVDLEVSQWRDAERAAEELDALVSGLGVEAEREGPVVAGGEPAGRHVIGGRHALWTNGTTVLHLSGPADVVPVLYDAFGL